MASASAFGPGDCIHGLPINAKGEVLDKGRSSERLKAFEDLAREKPKPRLDHAAEQVLWQGPHDEALAKWQAAQKAHDQINSRNLSYSPLGGDFETPREPDAPRRPVIAGNSNSIFRTLLDAMKLPLPGLPIMAPGTENPLLTKDDLSHKGGLLSPGLPKTGLLSPYQPNDDSPRQPRQGLLGPIY